MKAKLRKLKPRPATTGGVNGEFEQHCCEPVNAKAHAGALAGGDRQFPPPPLIIPPAGFDTVLKTAFFFVIAVFTVHIGFS